MRYVMAQYETSFQSMTYRIFVTDYLKGIGRFDGRRYIEAITDVHKPVDTRTSDEIISGIKGKLSQLGGE